MSLTTWQKAVVACLRELSDTEQQKRSWLDGDGTEFPSPEELICQLFDDSGLDDLLATGDAFSPEADALLRDLSRRVDSMNLDQAASTLLKDRAWIDVGLIAKEALRLIGRISNT